MTNRKKQLTELAQRVMDGETLTYEEIANYPQLYFSKDTRFIVSWTKFEPSLETVKSLEQELLPDARVCLSQMEEHRWEVCLVDGRTPSHEFIELSNATAPTEEAARLAALLLALAEEEE